MSRYLGPRLRIVRRLGYLVGLTRKKPSTRLLNPDARRGIRKVLPPGQHGRSKSFKKKPYESNEYDFLIRLKLKQRIRYHYGITEKQLVNYVHQARKIKGSTGRVLLRLLEMRLDNTVFRLHMAPTIRAARQLITHGHIYINNKKVSIPSYSCKPKDIITPAPKTRSIQLLNNFLTELDLEKSRFKNLLKILKFGKKGLLNNPKTLNNKNISNQKDFKPNTIISLRIQRAGALEGQGIGFLGRNLVIVQPLFGNIKNYLGKSINICIYLKRENIFYGYPTKPFNIKMRYSKLINSIDAIQFFGRKKIQQNIQNKLSMNSIKSNDNDIKIIKNLNKSSSAIILMGGANILRNKLNKNNRNFRQNDNFLVRIEAASCGKNAKPVLNRKRQLSPFLLNKTRDTNPILFREKYLYSRKNRRFIGINHIFYVKIILKPVEQNPTNVINFANLQQKQQIETKMLIANSLFYSKLNKINPKNSNNSKFEEDITNTDFLFSKKNYNSVLVNQITLENSLKLKKYYLSKLRAYNLFIETKLSFISWCIRKEKCEMNIGKSKFNTISSSLLNINKKVLKQKLFKNLLSQIAIKKNFNINYFWKAMYLFSKMNLKQTKFNCIDSKRGLSLKKKILQKFCEMILDQQKDLSNKNTLFSKKTFLFFSKTFSLISKWKSTTLINNELFKNFINDIKESMSLLIVLQKSLILLLKTKEQYYSFNIKSNSILEYYKNQEFHILRNFKTKIKNRVNIQKIEKLSLNNITKINQLRKILELNSIKKESHFYQSLICNKKLFNSNMSCKIDIFNNCKNYLNNPKFINNFSIYQNSFRNRKNLIKKQLFKYRFELQIFINLFKKTTIFSDFSNYSKLNLVKKTENQIKENLLQKQILQKLNLIKIEFCLKKFILINFLNKLKNFNLISNDQNQQILFQINYYLSKENDKKYTNILSKLIKNNELLNQHIQLNVYLLNKIQNSILNEKIYQNLFSQQLDNIKKLEEIANLGLIFNLNKNKLINLTKNRVSIIIKLINFENNILITKTISNNLKKKIIHENFINTKKNIYLTKLSYFENATSLNFQTILKKIQQQIIKQKIKQKIEFLLVSKKYENHFIKILPIFNMDKNGKHLTNYISQLFNIKEKQLFKKLNKTDISFYPTEWNKQIIKQKILQMTTSWSNYIVIFNTVRELYQDNEITRNEYYILCNQTKQFIIKQLILNKNKILIGNHEYLKLGKNNINYFINQIKNNVNNFHFKKHNEFFQFTLIQMHQKYDQLLNLLINKEKLFLNQLFKNNFYLNRFLNIFDNTYNRMDLNYSSSQQILNKKIQNFQNLYNNILKYNNVKYKKSYQKLSSNVIMKLSTKISKWVQKISIIKLKKGISFLQKQQIITKPNSKLLISSLLKLNQNANKLINHALSLESVLLLKDNNIYLQKRIQSFINLLLRLNLSINYIKLNNEFNYPININLQNQLNKKLYLQKYNQTISNQQINLTIDKFTFYFNNKLQILTDLKIFDSSKILQFQRFITKMTNEMTQMNHLNKSMDETFYKTTKFVHQTIKFYNLFIYYHLKYFKKINKQYLLNNRIEQDSKEKNYLKNELLTKLFSKLSSLKQQNLLPITKYKKLFDQLKQQQLTKKLILNLFNEINLAKLEQLIEYKFIDSNYILYSKIQFFKFLTNFIILKERYEIKQNKNQKFINKIRIQLNQNFQNEFQYILYTSKFNKLIKTDILPNQQKDQIENQLINIVNIMKNFSKRSIKLQERLKYGFINYQKYETITQNLIKNLQFKIQKLINSFTSSLSEKNKVAYFYKYHFNNLQTINFNTSIKKIDLLQEICWDKLQKLMYFILNNSKGAFLDLNKKHFDYNSLLLNYFKKELQFTQILNFFKQIEKNANYLKDLKNEIKTKIISKTRKFYGTLTKNNLKIKISKNIEKSAYKNKTNLMIQKTKNQKNILQTFKLVLIKQFLSKIKNVIYHNFNQNYSIRVKISNLKLLLIENHSFEMEYLKINKVRFTLFDKNSSEFLSLRTNTLNNYFKKLQISLQLSIFNNFYSKKYAFKIYENLTSHHPKKLTKLKLVSINPDFALLNFKIDNISKSLQKSYKYKILLNTQNKNDKILNFLRIQKLKAYGLLSLKNKKFQTNKKIQELLNKLENILIVSNYSNSFLITKYLKFELNLVKKSEAIEELNKYIKKEINVISNKLNDFKTKSLIYSQKKYKKIKNLVLKTLLSQILISPNLESLKYLIKTNLISPKLYIKSKQVFYRKKLIAKLQNALFKLKRNSFNNSYEFKAIFPKIIFVLDKFNDLRILNLISNNQYNLIQTQIREIFKYEQFISRLIILKKQKILTDVEYNQILLKIQQQIVQKVREQKIVQKFKQYIEYLYETKITTQSSQNQKDRLLNNKLKKIISLNQGRWALVAIKEFYQQNLLTNVQYNELLQKIEKTIRKKIQIAKFFSNNRLNSQLTVSNKFIKSEYKRRQNQQSSKVLTSLPNIWTKNILKELRKQSIISNHTYGQIEKQIIDNDYSKINENPIETIQSSKGLMSRKLNSSKVEVKKDLKQLKIAIESLLNYKKQIIYWLSMVETTPINSDNKIQCMDSLTNLKMNQILSKKEYNKFKISNKLATNRLLRLKILQKKLNNLQYEKIYQKIIKSYLMIQFQYIQRLLRKKQLMLKEIEFSSKNQKLRVDKIIKKHFNKIKTSKTLSKNSNSLYSLLQEVLSQLPISTTNKTQSTYRQRIIYNRLYSRLRSDETLIRKWKQILTKILKKQLTPPLDIPPHLELKRIQISIPPINLTKRSKKHLIIPIGTVINLPSRKTAGISVLERLIVEYYSRN
nr:ribosomal protein S4 [Oedogonium angustistomum]